MRHVQKSIFPVLMIVVMILLFGTHSIHAAPGIMNYQGTLTDSAGLPVSATKAMTFKIYATISDTTTKWTSVIQSIVVKNGNFSVNLGEQDAFPTDLFDNDSLFLGVTVDGVELTPRKRLASVPYAISAGPGGIPKGGIIMWSGSVVPTGWALCDGQNGTPNLRDRFIIGAGNTYSIGNTGGEATHTLTIAEMPSHGHPFGFVQRVKGGTDSGQMWQNERHDNSTDSVGGGGAHNNLPPYYALCFIIKL